MKGLTINLLKSLRIGFIFIALIFAGLWLQKMFTLQGSWLYVILFFFSVLGAKYVSDRLKEK